MITKLKNIGIFIVLSFVILQGVGLLSGFIQGYVGNYLEEQYEIILGIFSNVVAGITFILITLKLIKKENIKNPISKKAMPKSETCIVMILLFFISITQVVVNQSVKIFFTYKDAIYKVQTLDSIGFTDDTIIFMFIDILLSFTVITPIIEELLFRKYALSKMSDTNIVLRILISSIAFALAHNITDIVRLITLIYAGSFFAIVYFKTRNIKFSIFAHGIFNFAYFLSPIIAVKFTFPVYKETIKFPIWIIISASIIFISCNIALFSILFKKNRITKTNEKPLPKTNTI